MSLIGFFQSRPAMTAMLSAAAGVFLLTIGNLGMLSQLETFSIPQMMIVSGSVGTISLLVWTLVRHKHLSALRTSRPAAHFARCALALASIGAIYVSFQMAQFGLDYMPPQLVLLDIPRYDHAGAGIIIFLSPLILYIQGITILGEPKNLIRLAMLLLGYILLWLIEPPMFEGFPNALYLAPLGAAVCLASTLLMTRWMEATESTLVQSFYLFFSVLMAGAILGAVVTPPVIADASSFFNPTPIVAIDMGWGAILWRWAPLVLAALIAFAGRLLVTEAYRQADVGLLAPFGYAIWVVGFLLVYVTHPPRDNFAELIVVLAFCTIGLIAILRAAWLKPPVTS